MVFYSKSTYDILRITHFSETTKDRNLIFGMVGDANVKLCIQHFLYLVFSRTSLGNLYTKMWSRSPPKTIYIYDLVFYLKKNRMAWRHAPFSWRHAPFSERHAPFDKKKRGAMYCRCALTPLWKYKKMTTDDRRKRKKEEMRKAEAASCRNLMTFFSRYIKCFTRRNMCELVIKCQFLINISIWMW